MSVSRFMECKGQFIVVDFTSTSDKPAAAHKGVVLTKHTRMVCRAGVDFARLASTREGIASGERGEVQPLAWGEWESFPYTIVHKGERYYRLYPSPAKSHRPCVRYFVNGEQVDRDAYMAYLTPSARDKANQPRDCFAVKASNCSFPDAIPDAADDATATDYPAVA